MWFHQHHVPFSLDWHRSRRFCDAVRQFHDRYATRPPDSAKAVELQTLLVLELEAELAVAQPDVYTRFESTGAAHDGVKIAADDDDVDFDVLAILRGGAGLLATHASTPGCARLRQRPGIELDAAVENVLVFDGIFSVERVVGTARIAERLFEDVQRCVNNSSTLSGKVKISRSGSAVRVEAYPDSTAFSWGTRLFVADVAPSFEVDGYLYAGRSAAAGAETGGGDAAPNAWSRCFAVQEKLRFDGMDRDNGCRKQVLRVLKAVRTRDVRLARLLNAYQLKTAFFRETDVQETWTSGQLGQRTMEVLIRVEEALSAGALPHYYLPEWNLVGGLSSTAILQLRDRLRSLRTGEVEMRRLLLSTKPIAESESAAAAASSADDESSTSTTTKDGTLLGQLQLALVFLTLLLITLIALLPLPLLVVIGVLAVGVVVVFLVLKRLKKI